MTTGSGDVQALELRGAAPDPVPAEPPPFYADNTGVVPLPVPRGTAPRQRPSTAARPRAVSGVGPFAPIRAVERRAPRPPGAPASVSGPPPGYGEADGGTHDRTESTARDQGAADRDSLGRTTPPGPGTALAVRPSADADTWTVPADPAEDADPRPTTAYTLHVNDEPCQVREAWIGESLLAVLRNRVGLPGPKEACGVGHCGACTVLLDGAPVASCLVPAAAAQETRVHTVEGLGAEVDDLRAALVALGAVQCGFCLPGIVAGVYDLLARDGSPGELDVREALAGNLCRCTGYNTLVDAVLAVARARRTVGAGPEPRHGGLHA